MIHVILFHPGNRDFIVTFQSQGYLENFVDPCDDAGAWLENIVSLYPAFTEGWALYSENPLLAKDVDIYKDDPLGKYGMLKWQVCAILSLLCYLNQWITRSLSFIC